jgi:hypothetical protein
LQNICVVLNKMDLKALTDASVAEGLAGDHGFQFFRTSVTDRATIEPVFQKVSDLLATINETLDFQSIIWAEAVPKPRGCCA